MASLRQLYLQEGIRNRTEPTEPNRPNRTEPFNSEIILIKHTHNSNSNSKSNHSDNNNNNHNNSNNNNANNDNNNNIVLLARCVWNCPQSLSSALSPGAGDKAEMPGSHKITSCQQEPTAHAAIFVLLARGE